MINPLFVVEIIAGLLLLVSVMANQFWLPVNVLASSRSRWSPWPAWSASVLHDFGISVRDFEPFDERCDLYELFGKRPCR